MNQEQRTGLTAEEREAIDRVTRRATEAHDRFVRELDGLLYDLHEYTDRQRHDPPPPLRAQERSERP